MILLKRITETENGQPIDVYAVCEDDGRVVCLEHPDDFSDIISSGGYSSARAQLTASKGEARLIFEEGRCQNKYVLCVKTPHHMNNAPDILHM